MARILTLLVALTVTANCSAEESGEACCEAPSRLAALSVAAAPRMTVRESERGKEVLIDGELFAGFLTDSGHQPVVWPIVGPTGDAMTRSFPLGDLGPGEADDHPHHESLWLSFDGVNGADSWHKLNPDHPRYSRILHDRFLSADQGGQSEVTICTANRWLGKGETVMTDERAYRFGIAGPGAEAPRTIDLTVCMNASHGPIEFNDTKEGMFAVRVPATMKVDAGLGGEFVNDRGDTDGAAWGRVARWVDYHGPVNAQGDSGGIVIMRHPDCSLPETRWHVREYGLFGANPFGKKGFSDEFPKKLPTTLPAGESLTFSYRVVFYAGDFSPEQTEAWYAAFAAKPLLSPAD